jgi:Tfp pilus assembly protein PilF
MKRAFLFLILVSFFILSGCGKEKNKELAMNYYQLSAMELNKDSESYYRQALHYIDLALREDCKPEFLARKATILFRLGDSEQSFSVFQKTLRMRISPEFRHEVLNNYGCLLASRGKQDDALKIFKELVLNKGYLTPEVALVNQGKVYLEQGKVKKAQTAFLQATQIAYNYVDAHYYLALVSSELNDREQAQCSLQATLMIEPSHRGAQELHNQLL